MEPGQQLTEAKQFSERYLVSISHLALLTSAAAVDFFSCKMKLLFPDIDSHRVEELAKKMRFLIQNTN